MTLRLSRKQMDEIRSAIRLLASPMEHASVDAWRSAVNRQLKGLVHADTAGFVLPVKDGPLLYTEEHDPGATSKFGEILPPDAPDGTPIWVKAMQKGAVTMETLYDGNLAHYQRSAYYNEFAKPNGAAQTLGICMSLGAAHPMGAALQLWRNPKNPKRYDDKDLALINLIFPALQVGVESYVRFGADAAEFMRACDLMGTPAVIYDTYGRVMHQTPACTRLMTSDPELGTLSLEMKRMASCLARLCHGDRDAGVLGATSTRVEKKTSSASYLIRASAMRASWMHGPWLMVSIERLTPEPVTAAQMQRAYGLTVAESRVGELLVQGMNAKQIADALKLSWSTVRRHMERIYMKAGVRSQVELVSKGSGRPQP
jgi:DNA-binding NarL/FixJ family response regulator